MEHKSVNNQDPDGREPESFELRRFNFTSYLQSKDKLRQIATKLHYLNAEKEAFGQPPVMNVEQLPRITRCKHIDHKLYAKGLCYLCYKKQRQPATGCKHTTRPNYAKNMCISCY